jgi:predicted Fe-Mo cluster-binding NifX family protein
MKIAITATGSTLDDVVTTHFGRCPYFLIVDPDTMQFEAHPNPNTNQGGGAGIQSAQLLADKQVSTVLTGNCGPNAIQTFGAAGIKVVTGASGWVRQAVQQYRAGTLEATSASNEDSHYRTGGMGGGKGRCCGHRGMYK